MWNEILNLNNKWNKFRTECNCIILTIKAFIVLCHAHQKSVQRVNLGMLLRIINVILLRW